ncbi:MAG TPA: DUF2752 domain-containing protein [Anaerolineae bacterium]|nr:DUF2752 domain-containing protein [Anaerolineae bacterium]HMR62380.1 DUF2752 domain-containing protein [Anaerolineae bacterium]
MLLTRFRHKLALLSGEFRTPILAWVMENRIAGLMITGATGLQLGLTAAGLPGWTCPFLHVLGVPCPGCGLSRASLALVQGDWATMLSLHAFAPGLVLALLLIAVGTVLPDQPRRRLIEGVARLEYRTGLTALLLVGLLLYWLVRLTLFTGPFIDLMRS